MKKLLFLFCLALLALLCLASCADEKTPQQTTAPEYDVTFSVGGVETTIKVSEGDLPIFPGSTDDLIDGSKTYRFAGWDKALSPASENVTYTAVYKRVLTIRWVLQNGVVTTEALADSIPEPKAGSIDSIMSESTVYTFVRWNKTPTAVSEADYDAARGNIIYTALYTESKRPYTATFKHNGEVIGTETVLYGSKPVFKGNAPTKAGYNYCGFTNTEKDATGDVVCESFFSMLDPVQLLWAYGQDDMSFDPSGKNDNRGSVFEEASGLIYMLLEIRSAPADSTFAAELKAKVIKSMKYFVSAEGCMAFFSLEPYWCYVPLTAVTLLASETPAIWDELTAAEKEKYDFMMKSLAYVLNFGNADGNNYKSGPGFRGNFHKSWNPNYRIANVIPMLFIGKYLGGADALDAILLDFSYDETVAQFEEYGWTRAITEWTAEPPTFDGVTAPTQKETMENGGSTFFVSGGEKTDSSGKGVRVPFRYAGYNSDQVADIIKNVFEYNYSGGKVISEMICKSGSVTERAYILDGTKSPYEGKDGMMLELGKENRSSTTYARDDFTMICAALAVLSELEMYDLETEGLKDNLFPKVWVGNMDYLYKIAHGYKSFATSTTPFSKESYEAESMAHYLWKSWWMTNYGSKYTLDTLPEYVKPFDPNLFTESFDELDLDLSGIGHMITGETCKLDMQAASPTTGVYYKSVVDPANASNKYLAFGMDHGNGGINMNLSARGDKGGLNSLGESMKMQLSFKLGKDPAATNGIETYLRLRGPGGTSDVFKIFNTTKGGDVTVFGTKITKLTTTMQAFVLTIDFKTGAYTVTVDGVEKINMTLTVAEHHAAPTTTSATTMLDWAKTTTSFVFNWYMVVGSESEHRGMIIDDLSYISVVPAE